MSVSVGCETRQRTIRRVNKRIEEDSEGNRTQDVKIERRPLWVKRQQEGQGKEKWREGESTKTSYA